MVLHVDVKFRLYFIVLWFIDGYIFFLSFNFIFKNLIKNITIGSNEVLVEWRKFFIQSNRIQDEVKCWI
jgi:hypothetical protein